MRNIFLAWAIPCTLILAGCQSTPKPIENEFWEVELTPEEPGVYMFEGRLVKQELDATGRITSSSALEMPAIRFMEGEGGEADFGNNGVGVRSKIEVTESPSRSVRYFMQWYKGHEQRSTRGTLRLHKP